MALQRFDVRTLDHRPWKNGGGTTQEVLCWPPDAGLDDFDWRVSIAAIGTSGPFSAFDGVARIITLLDGDGVHLQSADGVIDHRLDQPLAPFAFDGGMSIECTLLGSASSDFNVMSRRATGDVDMMIVKAAQTWTGAPAGLLMSVRGDWRCNDEYLAPGHGVWWTDARRDWTLAPSTEDAALIVVRRTPS